MENDQQLRGSYESLPPCTVGPPCHGTVVTVYFVHEPTRIQFMGLGSASVFLQPSSTLLLALSLIVIHMTRGRYLHECVSHCVRTWIQRYSVRKKEGEKACTKTYFQIRSNIQCMQCVCFADWALRSECPRLPWSALYPFLFPRPPGAYDPQTLIHIYIYVHTYTLSYIRTLSFFGLLCVCM